MSTGLYSGVSGLAIGSGLWKAFPGLWGGATGLIDLPQTLSLDFLGGAPLDSRITFSRGSQATLTDSTGKLTYAPNNLLTNSETFEAAAWVKTNTTVTANTAIAPDGTLTADTLTTSVASNPNIQLSLVGPQTGLTFIFSVWVRAGNTSEAIIQLFVNSGVPSGLVSVTGGIASGPGTVDLSSAASGTVRVTGLSSTAWTRFYAVGTSASTSGNFSAYIKNRISSPQIGDTTFIWGAQLEQVTYQTTPGTYNSTSPKNLLGYTQEFDNAAWTKSNAFVQTNLTSYSEQFDNAYWQTLRGTITANVETSPAGNSTADKFTEDATTNTRSTATSAITITSGATYTGSCYLKNIDRRYVSLLLMDQSTGLNGFLATFDLQNGTATTQSRGTGTVTSASIVDVGGGWYRCSVTGTAPTTTALFFVSPATTATPVQSTYGRESYLGDGVKSFLLWGAQLVQGATAGNYQPTYAAAAAVQYPAPDNSLTADKLVENTATSSHGIVFGSNPSIPANTPIAVSIYVKPDGRNLRVTAYTASNGLRATFNFSTLAVTNGSYGNSTYTSGTITDVGGGWYRITLLGIASSTETNPTYAFEMLNGTTLSYAGDGNSGLFIWGAQLSNSASVDPYVYNPGAAPTSAAYYGPRFDYDPATLAAKGLLIEEQRTNLLTYSEQFDNAAWSKTFVAVTANSAVAPDGTTNADLLTSSGDGSVRQGVACSANTAYTGSVWLRVTSGSSNINLYRNDNGTGFSTTVAAVTTTWQRFSLTATSSATATSAFLQIGGGSSLPNGATLLIWGAQLEAGAFATSYIPTVASQVTRSADVATMVGANFSNWYNQSEGTFAGEADAMVPLGSLNSYRMFSANTGASSDSIEASIYNSRWGGTVRVGGVQQADLFVASSYYPNVVSKVAFAYQQNNFAWSNNGIAPVTDTSGSVPNPNQLNIGGFTSVAMNGHIRRISYYNTRLGNATLQALTV